MRAYADAFADGDDVALVLLADPVVDGDDAAIEARVLAAAAAADVDLERVADIVILPHRGHGDDLARLHAACRRLRPAARGVRRARAARARRRPAGGRRRRRRARRAGAGGGPPRRHELKGRAIRAETHTDMPRKQDSRWR